MAWLAINFMRINRSGFTLIEVTVAIALIVLAFGGLMTIFLLSEDVKVAVKYDLIAQNLAKEGLELVRFKRDKNYNDGLQAFTSIYDVSGAPYKFLIDSSLAITPVVTTSTVQSVTPLTIFNSNYGYTIDSNSMTTIFKRLVTTTYFPAAVPPTLKVQVEVLWTADSKQKTITVQEELTDWRP